MPPCDIVLWCTKATANPVALPAILPHVLAPGGLTVLMQNGLGNEEEAAALVPHGAFHAGLCFLCSNRTAPGEIHHLEYGDILLGPPAGPPHPHLAQLRADLLRAGIDNELERDVPTARWRKLCWNIPFNGICGLGDCDTAQVLDDAGQTALVEELMREVVSGATACGHRLPPDLPQKMLARTVQMPPYLPSLVFDLRLGREPELEHLYRRPIAAAAAAGCAMPRTADLLTLLESRTRRAAARA
jgi:2-dehydropantoate 2-reductase